MSGLLRAGLLGVLLTVCACGGSTDTGSDDGGGGGLPGDSLVSADHAGGLDAAGSDEDGVDPLADGVGPDGGGVCTDGARQCSTSQPGVVEQCFGGTWSPRETCSAGRVCRDGECVITGECTPGQVRGCYNETALSVCNDSGTTYEPQDCDPGSYCIQGVCQDKLCAPGSTKCQDLHTVLHCSTDGTAWGNPSECLEGSVCNNGSCVSGCEAEIKLSSYIGCEYWTVDLDNYPDPFTTPMPFEVPHSVVISNPSHAPATIQFDTKFGQVIEFEDPIVMPGQAKAFEMPRQDIDGSGISWKSIRIRSSMPINAYQFNPFNNAQVFSNDGSLLLPVNTLGRKYIVASYPSGVPITMLNAPAQSGYVTIVATDPGTTQVTVRLSCDITAGPADADPAELVPALPAGSEHTFTLQQYQVLNLQAAPAFLQLWPPLATIHDLTGTLIEATKGVAVFGGHEEAVVARSQDDSTGGSGSTDPESEDSCCADHLEEQLLPVQVWTNDVLCGKAPPRSDPPEPDMWRVFSGADANQITTSPEIEGLHGQTLGYGQWVEVRSPVSFEVHGTGPVMAVQYTLSQAQTDDHVGDPAMIMAVPVGQYREDYRILVPEDYSTDWVTVLRPAGEQIVVDDVPTSVSFQPFGSGQWEVGWVQLDPGVHHLQATRPFGLIAFGWDSAVSYGYPAGLNLRAEDWTPAQ